MIRPDGSASIPREVASPPLKPLELRTHTVGSVAGGVQGRHSRSSGPLRYPPGEGGVA